MLKFTSCKSLTCPSITVTSQTFKFVLRKYKLTDITAENSGGSVLYTTKKT